MNLERCCMCPNVGTKNKMSPICPGISHSPHKEPSNCKFVKVWVDKEGSFVYVSLSFSTYSVEIHKRKRNSVKTLYLDKKGCAIVRRRSFDDAQRCLNLHAVNQCWVYL